MATDYTFLNRQLSALTEGCPYFCANLANASALLYSTLEEINWAGFYLLKDDRLILGPFQGKTACIVIPPGKGVCGAAAQGGSTVVVPDVHLFPGHIACDSASASEIVVPLYHNGKLFGVLDIDSPRKDRFSPEDRAGLEAFARILTDSITGDIPPVF